MMVTVIGESDSQKTEFDVSRDILGMEQAGEQARSNMAAYPER